MVNDVVPPALVNVTVYVQVWFCVSITGVGFRHVLVAGEALYGCTAKLAAPVPVTVGALLKVSVVVPTFLTVTDSVFVVATVPKANVAGDKLTSVTVPLTFRTICATPCGSPVKFAVTVPGITPSVDPGVKATLNVHVALAASVSGWVLQFPVVSPV